MKDRSMCNNYSLLNVKSIILFIIYIGIFDIMVNIGTMVIFYDDKKFVS